MVINLDSKKIKKLFKTGFFHIFGSSVLNKMITFASTIILVRIVSKSNYGVFSFAWNIYELLSLASGFGIVSGLLQICSEISINDSEYMPTYSFGVRYGSIVNLILAGVFIGISNLVPLSIPRSKELLMLMSLLPLVTLWVGIQSVFLRTNLRNSSYAKQQNISTILTATATILGAIYLGTKGMVMGRYFASIATVILSYFLLKVPLFSKDYTLIRSNYKRDIIKLSAISMSIEGMSQLLYLLDVLVIGHVMTDELAVASYKVATQVPTALSFLPTAVIIYIYPYFAKNHNNSSWCLRRFKQVIFGMGIVNAIISAILFLGAPLLIQTIYGLEYSDSVMAFRILSVSYFFSGTFRTITGNLLVTQRKLHFNFWVAAFSGILNIFFDYLFVSWWGIKGAAIATITIVVISSIANVKFYIYTVKN